MLFFKKKKNTGIGIVCHVNNEDENIDPFFENVGIVTREVFIFVCVLFLFFFCYYYFF
jgi:hypothetical protein